MKKLKILLIILIFINLIIASFFILDIQAFEAPDTHIHIDIIEINSNEIKFQTNLDISNPNSFDLSVNNLEVITYSEKNKEIGRLKIKGGNVPGDGTKTFSSDGSYNFKEEDFQVLKNTISGRISVNLLGIFTKSIPIEITVTTSVQNLLDDIDPPEVNIITGFDEITEKGIDFTAGINVKNPTKFQYTIKKLNLEILTDSGNQVGSFTLKGDTIQPNENMTFTSNGSILFDFLDANILIFDVNIEAGAKIAGINKTISVSTESSVTIPDIIDFIFQNEHVTFFLPVQFKLKLDGIHSTVGFKIYNPSNVSLIGQNLVCSMYRLDGEEMTELKEKEMETCQISPQKLVCIKTEFIIPYLNFIISGNKILPDWIILKIEGDFALAGTRQALPISLNAYVDPAFIKEKEII